MNIPQEIAGKYNFLKQQTYETLGIQFTPGVITYVPPVQTNYSESTATGAYSSNNYLSTGGNRKVNTSAPTSSLENPQLFTQLEELLKSFTDHLHNIQKSLILNDGEENSFIQDSLSKKFLEPMLAQQKELNQSPHSHHFPYSQLPRDFLQRVDHLKQDFDTQIKNLLDHYSLRRSELETQFDRKVDVLKSENGKLRVQIESSKQQRDRQECQGQQQEEILQQMRDDHQGYVTKLKQKYENEIYEIRTQAKNSGMYLDQFRAEIFGDMKNRVFTFVQEKNSNYITGYCQDQGGVSQSQIDPIELLIYIIQRMESDNNWLVDKLAELEEDKRRLMEKSQLEYMEEEILNGQIFADLIQQTKISDEILENFAFHRDELKATLDCTPLSSLSLPLQKQEHNQSVSINKNNSAGKENTHTQAQQQQQPITSIQNMSASLTKKHNFPTAANLRESLQSNRSTGQNNNNDANSNGLSKSQSGKNLSLKYQNLMKNQQVGTQNANNRGSLESKISGAVVQDDESAILGGTLNAMILKGSENHNQNMQSITNGQNNQFNNQLQNNHMMNANPQLYTSIDSNPSHKFNILGESTTDFYTDYQTKYQQNLIQS